MIYNQAGHIKGAAKPQASCTNQTRLQTYQSFSMAGSLIPTAAQDGDGAMPSAPPKLGGGAKSKNQLRRMKAKAKKIADQGIDKSNGVKVERGAEEDQVKEEDDVPVRVEDSRWLCVPDVLNVDLCCLTKDACIL